MKKLVLWSIPTGIMLLLSAALSLDWATILLSLVLFIAHCLAIVGTFRLSGKQAVLSQKNFVIVKKTVSYFALAEFILNCVNLIVAWSNLHIELPAYYPLYALVVVSYGLYLPMFLDVNSKKNLERKGLLKTVSKNGKTKTVYVKLFKGFLAEVMGWIDAIIWTVVLVIFIQSLVFQLYQIPTESMVPEHYVGSRVMAVKTLYNPEIPLSLVDIPVTVGIKRFDQLVLNNPRHEYARNKALNEFFNNVLFMVTFSLVQRPKIDINGEEVVEPLIKRLIGMPGDQLMMIDDVVYVRHDMNDEFEELTEDSQYALNFTTNLPVNMDRIERVTVPQNLRGQMLIWDDEKNSVWDNYIDQAQPLLQWFQNISADNSIDIPFLSPAPSFMFHSWFQLDEDDLKDYAEYALRFPEDFSQLLEEFMLGSFQYGRNQEDAYQVSARNANLVFKLKLAKAIQEQILTPEDSDISARPALQELNLFMNTYIQAYFDIRNFPPFPENGVLEAGEYFFMGDNRYNSLDSRHWDESHYYEEALDSQDPYSLTFLSKLIPFSINERDIRGKAVLGVF